MGGRQEHGDSEGVVPEQWAGWHAPDALTPCARLYRAVVLDAIQAVGRYVRARRSGLVGLNLEEHRRQLAAWLSAEGLSARRYRVPFDTAVAHGLPGVDPDALRRALLAGLGVRPRSARMGAMFTTSILRRQYVRRPQCDEGADDDAG